LWEARPPSKASQKHGTNQDSTVSPSSKGIDGSSKAAPDWEDEPNLNISAFSELPHSQFGVNQHMTINAEFKEALRQILWQFRAPIRYAFAYGSAVFPQTKSATSSKSEAWKAQGKMIDMIFGVSYSQHWHSLNIQQHRDHYSFLGSLGSGLVTNVQEKWGAGVYFNPYVTVNGIQIKYGVVNLDTLCKDLSQWDTLYLAGRLQKPVKILRDDPGVRLANQINLISALRTALLLLPPKFDERQLYEAIAGISYLGDPRMSLPSENPRKVANIVENQLPHFRRLYAPLIETLPNVQFHDPRCSKPYWEDDPDLIASLAQDMDPVKRGNMVRRLPSSFREKLYFQYQSKFEIPRAQFDKMMEEKSDGDSTRINRRQGGLFEQKIAKDETGLKTEVAEAIKKTIKWPSISQSLKGVLTAGFGNSWRYMMEKRKKYREGTTKEKASAENSSRRCSSGDQAAASERASTKDKSQRQ
jgi:translocator assembly and maintenance protein 41